MNSPNKYFIIGLLIFVVVFVSSCVSLQSEKGTIETTPTPSSAPSQRNASPQLDTLCTGEEECVSFCLNNRGQCEEYCKENNNELCLLVLPDSEKSETEIKTEQKRESGKNQECEGTKTKFDFAPVNLDKTRVFLPLGLMVGGHVTPIDHHYFQNFENKKFDIEIYSPGKGHITSIQHMPGAKEGEDYRIIIEHTCTISSIYIHVGLLTERLQKYAPEGMNTNSGNIPVEAGELLGYYKTNVDYNLVDTEIVLPGFIVPEHYKAESWKIHIPNTYDYFNEPVRSKIIEKSLRTVEPLAGKIDYDIDGKLVGNWFLEGTDGYAGESTSLERYWLGHLSIVYDAYDPTQIVFSIGNYDGDSRQFAVKGNAPDPAMISVEDGMIKYELVGYEYITSDGTSWDRRSAVKGLKTKSYDFVEGVVLVQMISDRKIKFEAFPRKTALQVNGFTSKAEIYER